jgi:Ca-activated chloride channel family protein
MRSPRFFWAPLPLLLLASCSLDGKPKQPLELREAPSAICGGGASRKGDGKGGNGTGGNSGTTTTGTYTNAGGSGGGGYVGGGGFGATGGVGGVTGGVGGGGATNCGGSGGSGGAGNGGCGGVVAGGAGGGGAGGGGAGGSGGAIAGGSGGAGASAAVPEKKPLVANDCSGIDLNAPAKLYLSSDDSNSMASAAIVRAQIHGGATEISPAVLRTYEILNYYRYQFAPPPAGSLSIVSQLGSCALSGDLALQIAVTSPASVADRLPMSVTLVLDTSGSMEGSPIELERAAVKAIASTLRQGDIVSAVTWSVGQTAMLDGYTVTAPNDPTLVNLADSLQASGGTDLNGGLQAGYALAKQYQAPNRINRVILISDGQANVGVTEEEIIGAAAKDEDAEGIYLVGVGVGDGINDTLMDTVTDAGRGAYIYLDSPEEAARMFVDRFPETVQVAARDVRIELTLPPYFKIQKFYGEEYSPDPAKVRTQHLAPDDSMMLYQIIHPCDPSLPSANDPYKVVVTWKDPQSGASLSATQDTTLGALGIDDGNLSKAAAIIAYTEAVKALPPLDQADRIATLQDARTFVKSVDPSAADPDLVEIEGLLGQLIVNNGG